MDLQKILAELHAERQRLGRIIDTLEQMHLRAINPPKRGRKGMDAAARKAVSVRMRRYWSSRREQPGETPAPKPPK